MRAVVFTFVASVFVACGLFSGHEMRYSKGGGFIAAFRALFDAGTVMDTPSNGKRLLECNKNCIKRKLQKEMGKMETATMEEVEKDNGIGPKMKINKYQTPYDGGILVPARNYNEILICKGGTSAQTRNWNNPSNVLWSMKLRDAEGVAKEDMKDYNRLWPMDRALNDAKRVVHNGKNHIAVCGAGGDAVALFEFETKKCVYWSHTTGRSPHDVEYVPLRGGYLAVANPKIGEMTIELYDISKNDMGAVKGASVRHSGVHSVHWDGRQKKLWAWGAGIKGGLKSYKVIFVGGEPRLELEREYMVKVPGQHFHVGTGHGGSPMLVGHKRFLLLAGKDGILQFDTEQATWKVFESASNNPSRSIGLPPIFTNPKGLSYSTKTGEVLIAKSMPRVFSEKSPNREGVRRLNGAGIYKVRWWQHEDFSLPLDGVVLPHYPKEKELVGDICKEVCSGQGEEDVAGTPTNQKLTLAATGKEVFCSYVNAVAGKEEKRCNEETIDGKLVKDKCPNEC